MKTYEINSNKNLKLIGFLDMYCMGKPKVWNWFFGWRKTEVVGINDYRYYYKVPKKIYKEAENFVEMYNAML